MIFISATDTNVGKTYTSVALLHELKKHYASNELAYYKVIQCGRDPVTNDDDLSVVKRAHPDVDTHYSYYFEYPAAPSVAAEQENAEVDIAKLKTDFEKLKSQYRSMIVEGAGGLAVPITEDYLIADLAKDLDLPLLLVIRPDLGTINHSVMSIEYARNKGLDLMALYVSNYPKDIENPKIYISSAPSIISKIGNAPVYTELDELMRDKIVGANQKVFN